MLYRNIILWKISKCCLSIGIIILKTLLDSRHCRSQLITNPQNPHTSDDANNSNKNYQDYIRSHRRYVRPVLSAEAAIKLQEFYLSLREKHGNSESTPVTTRSVDITITLILSWNPTFKSKPHTHTHRERERERERCANIHSIHTAT